jgi:tetratricopeptide (TPR) repeat protein
LDPEDVHGLIQSYFDTVQAIVVRLGGTVDRYLGDAVMAVFGAAIAHEDDALRAVHASLEIQAAMPQLSQRFGMPLQCAIGIATGNVVVMQPRAGSPADVSMLGESINLAARIQDLGCPGEVLVSESVYRIVAHQVLALSRGRHTFKGFASPVQVLRIKGLRDVASPAPVGFVGRKDELAQTHSQQQQVLENSAAILVVSAPAGMGKSRFCAQVVSRGISAGFAVHRGGFLDFGLRRGTEGIHAVVCSLLGVWPDSSASERQQAARHAVERGFVPSQCLPSLFELVSVAQTEATRSAFDAMNHLARELALDEAVAQLLRSASAVCPQLLVLEDLHWADAAERRQWARIASRCQSLPVWLLVTTRTAGPQFDAELTVPSGLAPLVITLQPLLSQDLQLMASNLGTFDRRVIASCIDRCEGNPLFFEQMLRHVQDIGGATLPPSIRSLMLARMDQLEPLHRLALQAAAVLGQRFALDALRVLLNDPHYECATLIQAHLLQADSGGYAFEHALIHEAAYSTLLNRNAHELHRRAADWYAAIDPWLRAQHLDRAQDPAAPQAYTQSASADIEQGLYDRARPQIERATVIANVLEDRVELALLQGRMLHDTGDVPGATQAYRQTLDLAATDAHQCRAWTGLAACQRLSDEIDGALFSLDQAQALAEPLGLDADLSRIHYLRGSVKFPQGDIAACLKEHATALGHATKAKLRKAQAEALSGLGDAYYARGLMLAAYQQFRQCLDLCEAQGFGRIEASNRFMLATVRIYLNETQGALKDALECADLAQRVSNLRAEIVSRLTAAWILISLGRLEDAAAQVERGLSATQSLGSGRFRPFLLESSARIALLQGDTDLAYQVTQQALELARGASMMRFIGPWLLGTAAWCSTDDAARTAALVEGESLLQQGCVGHNYYRFYTHAMEASLQAGDAARCAHWATALEKYTRQEPNPWADFYIEFARLRCSPPVEMPAQVAQTQSLLQVAKTAGFEREIGILSELLTPSFYLSLT